MEGMTAEQLPDLPHSRPTPEVTLADKINDLFIRFRPYGDREYTLEEVAAGMRERHGVSITAAYLSQLRRGRRTNPSRNVLEALADFFRVNSSYFFGPQTDDGIADQLDIQVVLRNPQVRLLATRAADLPPESLHALVMITEEMRRLHGPTRRRRAKRKRSSGFSGMEAQDFA